MNQNIFQIKNNLCSRRRYPITMTKQVFLNDNFDADNFVVDEITEKERGISDKAENTHLLCKGKYLCMADLLLN